MPLKEAKINDIKGIGKATITKIQNLKICQGEFVADREEDIRVLIDFYHSNENPYETSFTGTVYEGHHEKVLTFPITINVQPIGKRISFVAYGDPKGSR